MSITSFIGDHTLLFGIGVVVIFAIWKFMVQPIMNEGEPLDPKPTKTISEQLGLDNLTNEIEPSSPY